MPALKEAPQLDVGVPLNPEHIARIDGTHRGFIYQHAYAAACLLAIRGSDAIVVVEHDEDVEILWNGRRAYIQVKFRRTGLTAPRSPNS